MEPEDPFPAGFLRGGCVDLNGKFLTKYTYELMMVVYGVTKEKNSREFPSQVHHLGELPGYVIHISDNVNNAS